MQIFVIGMHRSGTSVVARLLNLMGAYFGPEGISTGAGPENPKGFWERKDVRAINNQILHAAHAEWYQISDFSLEKISPYELDLINKEIQKLILELDANRPWFLKEPRFCLTFPLWRKYLEFPICIHTYRSPIQIAQSLKTRNNFPLHFGIALWEKYTLESLKATRDYPRLWVSHAQLIQKPLSVATTLHQQLTKLGCQGLRLPDQKEILAFITPKLYRERGNADLESSFVNQQQIQLITTFTNGHILDVPSDLDSSNLSPEALEILHTEETTKQKEDELQACLQELTHTLHDQKKIKHSLEQENLEIKAYNQNLKNDNQNLKNDNQNLKNDNQNLKIIINNLQNKAAHLKQTQYWISQLINNNEALLQSWRWKAGNFLVRLVEVILLRPKPTLATDHIQTIIKQIHPKNTSLQLANPQSITKNKSVASDQHCISHSLGIRDNKTTIIICIHNAPIEVQACLESIEKHTNLRRHKLILVDDGSDTPTQRIIAEYTTKLGAKLIRNQTALGYTKAANQGLREVQQGYCLLLNSDTIVTPNWLDRLVRCATLNPHTACVGPLSNAASWQSIPDLLDNNGKWYINKLPEGISLDEYAHQIAIHSPRLYPQVQFINGFCYLINWEALKNLGYLDENTFPKGYGEEDDFSIRAQDAGWTLRIADDCYIYHAKSKSFTPQVRSEIVITTKNALQVKHGELKVKTLLQQIQSNEPLLIARTLAKIATQSTTIKSNSINLNTQQSINHIRLHIGWLQPHLNIVGGIRRAIEMTNRLAGLGFEVTLITPDGKKTNWLPINAQVINTDQAKSIKFDVLIISDPDTYPFFTEISADLRINYHLAPYHIYRKPDKNLESYYCAPYNLGIIHHIANSKWTADSAKSTYGINNEGIFPGGIDSYLFFPHNEKKIYDVIFYGSNRPHKGTATILSATSGLSTLSLTTLNAQQHDLARYICQGRVFASACWHEGFNFFPLEAMACGIPVAMTDDGGSREYAVNQENALVVPINDPQALREAIYELLNNTNLRLRLIENGLLTASQYNWDQVTANFSMLILKLYAQNSGTPTNSP